MGEIETLKLVKMAKAGDQAAFEKLLLQYQALLFSLSKIYFGKCPEGLGGFDDFLQEANIAFFKAVESYDELHGHTIGVYARTCVRNRLVSYIRELTSRKRNENKLARKRNVNNKVDEVLYDFSNDEGLKMAREIALSVLSKYEYMIFEMYHFLGLRAKEIAKRLGKSEKSINNAIYRMKVKMKNKKPN